MVREIGTPRVRIKGTEQIEYGLFANSAATNMDGLYDGVKKGRIALCSQAEVKNLQRKYSFAKCRMCYEERATPEDPLIEVCKCQGVAGFAHFMCVSRLFSESRKQ